MLTSFCSRTNIQSPRNPVARLDPKPPSPPETTQFLDVIDGRKKPYDEHGRGTHLAMSGFEQSSERISLRNQQVVRQFLEEGNFEALEGVRRQNAPSPGMEISLLDKEMQALTSADNGEPGSPKDIDPRPGKVQYGEEGNPFGPAMEYQGSSERGYLQKSENQQVGIQADYALFDEDFVRRMFVYETPKGTIFEADHFDRENPDASYSLIANTTPGSRVGSSFKQL